MEQLIGKRITQIRTSKDITIETLAERSELSIDQLQNIENDKVIPSLSPLIKIARALGVRLGTFLDDNDFIGPVVTRKDNGDNSISFSNNEESSRIAMSYQSLAGKKSGRHMEPFIIDVQLNESAHKLSQHEGEEFIFVFSGCVEVEYGTEKYILNEGDSIYYDSIVSHHVHACGNTDAKILAVVYVPV